MAKKKQKENQNVNQNAGKLWVQITCGVLCVLMVLGVAVILLSNL